MPYKSIEDRRAAWHRWSKKNKRNKSFKDVARNSARRTYKKRLICSIKECTNLGDRHHEDYAKPKEIIWLCRKHHGLLHRKNRICSVDGCGKAHLARGYCNVHWKRWRRGRL